MINFLISPFSKKKIQKNEQQNFYYTEDLLEKYFIEYNVIKFLKHI